MPLELTITQQIEEQYRLLVESVQDYGIFLLDRHGYIQTWNQGAYRIKGYSTHEILGKHFSLFYSQQEIINGKPARQLEIALRQGRHEEEGWRIRKDQSRFWANVIITPVYNQQGQHTGFSKVTRDLSQRKQYEDALRASEQQKHQQAQLLLTIIDHSPAGIALFEPILNAEGQPIDFKFKQTNRTNAAAIGQTVEELIGYSLQALFPPAQTRHFWQQLIACYQTGQPQQLTEHYTGDGLAMWIDGTFVKQGEDVLWVFQDVTPLKQAQLALEERLISLQQAKQQVDIDLVRLQVAEQEVSRALDREREMNTLKSEFVNLVSHQFRTPITSILLKAEALQRFSNRCQDPYFAQKVVEYCQQVGQDVHRLNKLISEVLINERMQSGQIQARRQPVNLVDFCQNLISQQGQYETAYQRVQFHGADPNMQVCVDPTLLEQVLENLISNALKYSAESQKPVEVLVEKTPTECVVTVKDYGIGIPTHELAHVSKSFYRASNATHYPGTGLGLSLSRRLVELHGGRLLIESRHNQYTVCTITLPLYEADKNRCA
ncbi:PAS domain-containing sensor histidine kinase [Larkinella arboricola]